MGIYKKSVFNSTIKKATTDIKIPIKKIWSKSAKTIFSVILATMKGYVDIHINALKEIFQIDIQSNKIKITHISTSEELAKKSYFKGFARIELVMNDEMLNLLG